MLLSTKFTQQVALYAPRHLTRHQIALPSLQDSYSAMGFLRPVPCDAITYQHKRGLLYLLERIAAEVEQKLDEELDIPIGQIGNETGGIMRRIYKWKRYTQEITELRRKVAVMEYRYCHEEMFGGVVDECERENRREMEVMLEERGYNA